MKRVILVLALAALAACSNGGTTRGVVDSVQEVELREAEDRATHYEHPLVPEVAWRIVVQLDDGAGVTLTYSGAKRFQPGERVYLFKGSDGALFL